MDDAALLTSYYITQAGTGAGSFYSGPMYQRGSGRSQRGAGIGSFLGGLFRRMLPILRKGTEAVGREVIKSGANFLTDLGDNVIPCVAFKKRTREGIANLTSKVLDGDAYKAHHTPKIRQTNKVSRANNIKSK